VEGKVERRDIVIDSQTYTPQTHRDVFTNSNVHEMKSPYLDTYEGVQTLLNK